MIKQCTLSLLGVFYCITSLFAQIPCDPGQSRLRLELTPDYYWYEVSWQVRDVQNNQILAQDVCVDESAVTKEYCVPSNTCIEFRMQDNAGDGIAPNGFYKIYLNDTLVFENLTGIYGYNEVTTIGCPPGINCSDPLPIDTGAMTTLPGGFTTWHTFTPSQNGLFQISTCDTANHCPTKIWVYGTECGFIVPFESNQGTLFYSSGGCSNDSSLAVASLFLEGGQNYFIRVGYANNNLCGGAPIHFDLSYEGAIVGCMDTLACNYNPLASVSGDCIYPGSPDCPEAPDLMVVQEAISSSFQLSSLENIDPCAVEEGCLKGFGLRNLIRFDTRIENIGEADYYIGHTPVSPTTPSNQFVFDPCHSHWHYRGYAEYILYNQQGKYIPIGSKNGFCVLDLECSSGTEKYTCENMGISAGCGDIYDSYLDCQWLDITGLDAGQYTFVLRVNWDKTPDKLGRIEKTYDNNWGQVCFKLSYSSNGAPDVEIIDDCVPYVDCLGVTYGSAEQDCEAVCNGTALFGDINHDLSRDADDVVQYLESALLDTAATTTCRDLFADQHLDVYDAALLQECALHGDSIAYWGSTFACEFPTGKQNPNDLVNFRLGTLDTIAKTLDVRISNPFNKILGYELAFSGIVIDSVKNLSSEFNATFVHTDTRVIALSQTEQAMNKHAQPTGVLRLYYSSMSGTQACIDSVISAVSDKYIKSNATISLPKCVNLMTSSAAEIPVAGAFPISVMPNPATSSVSVFFKNDAKLPTDITLLDIQGRVVRSYPSVYDNTVTLSRQNLPDGIYLIHLRNENGLAVAKLIWQ